MAQFDVHRLKGARDHLVVDVQSGFLSHLNSRVVIPLAGPDDFDRGGFSVLTPSVNVDGITFKLVTPNISALAVRELGTIVANIEQEHRDHITRAQDLLFQGY